MSPIIIALILPISTLAIDVTDHHCTHINHIILELSQIIIAIIFIILISELSQIIIALILIISILE